MGAGFLRHNIEFTQEEKRVSLGTRLLNTIGNFLLSPARHLFSGKTVTAINVPQEHGNNLVQFDEVKRPEPDRGGVKFLKTVASIVCFVPGIILGSAVKGIALATSSSLRTQYSLLSQTSAQAKTSKIWAERPSSLPPTLPTSLPPTFPQNSSHFLPLPAQNKTQLPGESSQNAPTLEQASSPLSLPPDREAPHSTSDQVTAPSALDQKIVLWEESADNPWTQTVSAQLRQSFPAEVLNVLTEKNRVFFNGAQIRVIVEKDKDPQLNAEEVFRKMIDFYFINIILPNIELSLRAKIPLTMELKQNFPQSYEYLLQERSGTLLPQEPSPKSQASMTTPFLPPHPTITYPSGYEKFPAGMSHEDRLKFIEKGILFDSAGHVTQCPSPYRAEQEPSRWGSNNCHVTIFHGDQKIVRVNTKTTRYEAYSYVFWENK